jgi:hypothetical protein
MIHCNTSQFVENECVENGIICPESDIYKLAYHYFR